MLFPTCRHVIGSPGYGEHLGVAVLDAGDELDGGAVRRVHAQHHATRVQPKKSHIHRTSDNWTEFNIL